MEHRTTHVVYPGTFDPFTNGHLDVALRAASMFDELTIAVAASRTKRGTGTVFSLEERCDLVRGALAAHDLGAQVEVKPMYGLLVDFCREEQAHAVIRGLRMVKDFETEWQQAALNATMAPEIESLFVMSNSRLGYVSSSLVREIASMGADVHDLVPKNVEEALLRLYSPIDKQLH